MQAVFIILYFLLGIVQIAAFLAGIKLWLGLGTFLGLVIFFLSASVPLGSIADAAIAFYGAYGAWQWPWWQAALLTFPFAILGTAAMGIGGIANLIMTTFSRPAERL
jgi:hypothetical protein